VPMEQLLRQSSYNPDTTSILTSAFDAAWEKLCQAYPQHREMAAASREALAKHILELANEGELDQYRLINRAVQRIAG
jgi:hypothetical protein